MLLGENGAGKTNILDGIAVGLGAVATLVPEVAGSSFKNTDLLQKDNKRAPYTRVVLTTKDGLSWDRTEKRNKLPQVLKQIPKAYGIANLKTAIEKQLEEANEGSAEFPLFAYYGVSRALIDVPLRRRGFPKAYNRYHSLRGALDAASRFRSAFKWFYAKEQEELRLQRDRRDFEVQLPELKAVRDAIELVFPGIKDPRIETNPLRLVVDKDGEKLGITQLSDGYKTMLALVIDMASRMALANPQYKNPLDSEATVMIDEIDLHLHPEWQRRVVGDLLRVFPRAQFIFTTHSPYIVESINNHLQRFHIAHEEQANLALKNNNSLPLDSSDICAYLLEKHKASSMMDAEVGLLDNSLLETFNTISREFNTLTERN